MKTNQPELDVLLIRPLFTSRIYEGVYKTTYRVNSKKVDPPMALMQLATPLVDSGLKVKILDGEIEDLNLDELAETAVNLRPVFVGITSTTPESNDAMEIIRKIKRKSPKTICIFGGAHATHVPWEITEKLPEIDFVVVYEGEKAMKAICTNDNSRILEYRANATHLLEDAGVVQGNVSGKILLGECQNTTDLENNLPCRDPKVINLDHYMATDPGYGLLYSDSVETARGCPYACTFCSSAKSGLGVRSVENLLDELELICRIRQHNNRELLVTFLDDTFTFNRDRATQIFEGILKRNLKIRFRAFTRANTIWTKHGQEADLNFVKLMMRAGSTALSFGVESGSATILESLHKGVTLDDYEGAYYILEKAGFKERRGSFIVGNPHETTKTIIESIKFAKKIRLNRIGVNIMTPYPGTEIYDQARLGKGLYFEKKATNASNYKRWGHSIVSTPDLSSEALVFWQKRFLTEINTSYHGMSFFASNLLRGNFSEYYHQPTVAALKSIPILFNTPEFPKPDHTGYNPDDFGRSHITKNTIIRVLNTRYGVGFSKKKHELNPSVPS